MLTPRRTIKAEFTDVADTGAPATGGGGPPDPFTAAIQARGAAQATPAAQAPVAPTPAPQEQAPAPEPAPAPTPQAPPAPTPSAPQVPLGPNADQPANVQPEQPPEDQGQGEDQLVDYPMVLSGLETIGALAGGTVGAAGGVAGGVVPALVTTPAGAVGGGLIAHQLYFAGQNLIHVLRGTKDKNGMYYSLSQETLDMIRSGLQSLGAWGGGAALENAILPMAESLAAKGVASSEMAGKYIYGAAAQGVRAMTRIIGGALGTSAGTLSADGAARVAKVMDLLPPDARTPDMYESLKDAENAGILDAVFNAAFHTTLPAKAAARMLLDKAIGIKPEHIEAAALARENGINLGYTNLTTSHLVSMYRAVVGIMPLMAGPYQTLAKKQRGVIENYADTMAARAAQASPNARYPVPEPAYVSKEHALLAEQSFDRFIETTQNERARILAEAKTDGVSFDTQYAGAQRPDGSTIRSMKDLSGRYINTVKRVTGNSAVLNLAQKVWDSKQYMTMDQASGYLEAAENLAQGGQKMSPRDREYLSQLVESIEGSFESGTKLNSRGKSVPSDLGTEYKQLRDSYLNAMRVFKQSTVSRIFTRAKPDIFNEDKARQRIQAAAQGQEVPGRAGAIPEDMLSGALYSDKITADQVDEIYNVLSQGGNVVGAKKAMRNAASSLIDRAANDSIDNPLTPDAIFNPKRFADRMGLNDPRSPRYQAMQKVLEYSGIKIQDLKKFTDAASIVAGTPVPETSKMLARAVTIGGGFSAVLGHIFPVLEAEMEAHGKGPVLLTVAGLLLGRKASVILSNPAYLQDMNTFLDHSAGLAQRRMAYLRILRAYSPDFGFADEKRPSAGGKGGPGKGLNMPPEMKKPFGAAADAASNFLYPQ